jgi:transketolase
LQEATAEPKAIIIATGSEVEIAREAAAMLEAEGLPTRLVSMPSAEIFQQQPEEYQEAVLPSRLRTRVAVEAGHGDYWRKWVGLDGAVVSLDRFGESGPGAEVMAHFGFSADRIFSVVKGLV